MQEKAPHTVLHNDHQKNKKTRLFKESIDKIRKRFFGHEHFLPASVLRGVLLASQDGSSVLGWHSIYKAQETYKPEAFPHHSSLLCPEKLSCSHAQAKGGSFQEVPRVQSSCLHTCDCLSIYTLTRTSFQIHKKANVPG